MRPLIIKTDISLDGFVAAPDGDNAWIFDDADEEGRAWVLDIVRGAGAHLMGRVTYGDMAGHWPTSDDAFAAPMNEIPKVVFSSTLTEAPWGPARIARGPLAEEVAKLKAEDGGPLVAYGGARFVQSLAAENLIDEYRLLQHPIALGAGLPAFRARRRLRPTAPRRSPRGAVALPSAPACPRCRRRGLRTAACTRGADTVRRGAGAIRRGRARREPEEEE